jgi:ATP-dependent RNA helicase SUPV3L1/SUV3
MMSLVGCSGEDFLGILKSLDFRMQKKTVKKPVAAHARHTRAAGNSRSAPGGDASRAARGESPQTPPLNPPEPPSETPGRTADARGGAAASGRRVKPPLPKWPPWRFRKPPLPWKDVEIEVWWPKDTGPFRHRAEKPRENARPQHRRKPDAAAGAAAPAAEGQERPKAEHAPGVNARRAGISVKPQRDDRKPQRDERPPQREERKPRPEKPMDPNSPFAVLGALKAKLDRQDLRAPLPAETRQRLDKWLWFARIVKTRPRLAAGPGDQGSCAHQPQPGGEARA